MTRLLCIILCLAALACNKQDTPETSSTRVHANQIIAYRFEIKPGDPSLPDHGFSLIQPSGKIDLGLLQRLKKKEAVLDQTQIKKLETAVYGNHPVFQSAACYDPHHIFVYYDSNGHVGKAIEVCFGCTKIIAHPEISSEQSSKHDFISLARLCDEIGIGMTQGSAEDQIKFWKEHRAF